MKTAAVIFWSLLLALFWATTSLADTSATDSALDHVTQRNIHARLQAAPADKSVLATCVAKADCDELVEHFCQTCLFMLDDVVAGGLGSRQYIEPGHIALAALGYARDILDPPRI